MKGVSISSIDEKLNSARRRVVLFLAIFPFIVSAFFVLLFARTVLADGACSYFCPDGTIFLDNPNPHDGWLTIVSTGEVIRPPDHKIPVVTSGSVVRYSGTVEGGANSIYFEDRKGGAIVASERKYAGSGVLYKDFTLTTVGRHSIALSLGYPRSMRVCTFYTVGQEMEGVRPNCAVNQPTPTKAQRDASGDPAVYCAWDTNNRGPDNCYGRNYDSSLPDDGILVDVVVCSSSSDCDDGDSCTLDTCLLPGTVSSSCTHTNVPVNGTRTCTVWGTCTQTCGGGTQPCTTSTCSATCGGTCPAVLDQACNSQACPINGGWTNWSTCSLTCGGGTQTRTCTNPTPANGGADCSALDGGNSSQVCNAQLCSCNGVCTGDTQCSSGHCTLDGCRNAACDTESDCTCNIACSSNPDCNDVNSCTTDTCLNPGTPTAACSNTITPVNGTWTYSAWGVCSGSCGGGAGTQTRTALSCSATCGGTCGAAVTTQACTNSSLCACNGSCTGDTQCLSGYCTLDGCRNPMCETQPSCSCPACTTDADCDDGNACTTNTCTIATGVCSYPPVIPTDATWQQGGYGACSIPCGLGGTKSQTVTCSGALCGGSPVCNPLIKPAEIISCDGPGPCPCNQICDASNDCSSTYCNTSVGRCRSEDCPTEATCPTSGGTWSGCTPANPANWGSCVGGTCNGATPVVDSGEQTCTTATCTPVCGGSCGAVPTKNCTPACDGASVACDVIVGFGTATGSTCKSVKINSQGLIYGGGQVTCPD